jgi:putative transposase
MPILAVIGIRPDGVREVLAFSVGDCENQPAWEQLLDNLKDRGVEQVALWITDGNRAMLNAVETKFPTQNASVASSTRWKMSWATYRSNSAI